MRTTRLARIEDAGLLATLAEITFRSTFAWGNTASNLDAHCERSYGEAVQCQEIGDPRIATLVTEDCGHLIAYAQVRWLPPPSCVGSKHAAEIQRIYVHADHHGSGVAQELMSACFHAIRSRGSDTAWLGVWEKNPRAIAFYRKLGFVEVGEHMFMLGDDPQRDIIMVRSTAET